MLDKEFNWYLAHQEELVKEYNGRVLVIIGEKVVDNYDNYDNAFWGSVKNHKLGTFLLMECSEGEEAYTQTIYSPFYN